MKKLRIWIQSMKFSVAQVAIFRGSFVIFFLWLFIDTLIKILFFTAIYSKIDTIGGWGYWDCLLLVGFYGMMWDFSWTFFLSAITRFVDNFSTGGFDFILTKPMHPLTYITLTGFDATSFSFARIPIAVYLILFAPIVWFLPNVAIALVIFAAGLVALHALFSILATLAFWVVEAASVLELLFNVAEGTKYPVSIYPSVFRFIFTFFLPILFIANFPVLALKNMVGWEMAAAAIAIAVVLELIAYKVWDWGIKHYSSASS